MVGTKTAKSGGLREEGLANLGERFVALRPRRLLWNLKIAAYACLVRNDWYAAIGCTDPLFAGMRCPHSILTCFPNRHLFCRDFSLYSKLEARRRLHHAAHIVRILKRKTAPLKEAVYV